MPRLPIGPTPVTALVERRFRAMGCDCALVVVAPPGAAAGALDESLDEGVALLEALEQRWSRFREDSELSVLNREGRLEPASEETFAIVEAALEAWRLTDARFDPTILDALLAAGYDRTFDDLRRTAPLDPDRLRVAPAADDDAPREPVPGPVGIDLDARTRRIVLPPGLHLDLGGIGKGRAADAVAHLLHDRLGSGVCVDLGGDVRVLGPGPDDGPWGIVIEDPFDAGATLATIGLEAGAVATSARTRRTWDRGDEQRPAHHLIDPATGRPATSGLASVSVIAQEAQWAEVLAKAAFVAGLGPGADLIEQAGVEGLLVTDEGWVVRTPGFHRFEPPPSPPSAPVA